MNIRRIISSFVKVLGQLFFIFGLLGWIYGVMVQFLYPQWLDIQISHLATWLRIDTFTVACFILSAAGFFMWRLTRELISRSS